MSNEMISVPRELLERVCDTANGWVVSVDAIRELRALLAKPAEQHQAEPVYMVRTHGSCCWEEVGSGSLEDFQSMPEEYELRALYTQPGAQLDTETTSDKYKAELYDKVWQLARDMGFGNVTDALMKLNKQPAPVAVALPEQCHGATPAAISII